MLTLFILIKHSHFVLYLQKKRKMISCLFPLNKTWNLKNGFFYLDPVNFLCVFLPLVFCVFFLRSVEPYRRRCREAAGMLRCLFGGVAASVCELVLHSCCSATERVGSRNSERDAASGFKWWAASQHLLQTAWIRQISPISCPGLSWNRSGFGPRERMPMQSEPRGLSSVLHVVHPVAQPPGVPDYWPNLDLRVTWRRRASSHEFRLRPVRRNQTLFPNLLRDGEKDFE